MRSARQNSLSRLVSLTVLPATVSSASVSSLGILIARLLRLVAELHDVARREQDALEHLAPLRLLAQEELEVHPEVLHLLVLRVLHVRARLTVLLDREPLLVPADRLCFLHQRRDHAGEGARFRGKLFGRFVILV